MLAIVWFLAALVVQFAFQVLPDYQGHQDANARLTSYSYDARGNQISVTHADGTSEATGFDLENRKAWSQDRRGYRTFFVYDVVGRLLETIHPDADDQSGTGVSPVSSTDPRLANNSRTRSVYDLTGRVTDTYDELNRCTRTVYFPDGSSHAARRQQTVQVRTAGDLVTSYQYDHAGNVRFVTDPRGHTVETRYDEHGRPNRVIYPATDEHPGTETSISYDRLGRRVVTTDQEGKITRYRYDALGRLVEVRQYLDQALAAGDADYSLLATHASLLSTRYTYDELGAQTAQLDALGRVTAYESDRLGRRIKRMLPKDTAEASYLTENLHYDEWGNLWKRTDFAGKTTTFGYDALNRLKSKTADATHPSFAYSHAIARVEFDYDANGARTAARTFNAGNTPLYTETTPRDARGRLDYKDVAQPVAARLDYGYHANGLLKDTVSSNADGVNLGYRYDEVNRLAFVDDATGGVPAKTTSYTYNANGSLATLTLPNAVAHAYTYDTLNRLRTLTVTHGATTLHAYDYKLRASGHRRQVLEGARTITYTYDALYRLTGENRTGDPNGNNGDLGYALDKVGNRQSRSSSVSSVPAVANQTYNARDWLNGDTYSPNGSTLQGGTGVSPVGSFNDTYDFEERLILRTKTDGTTINLLYDADGHRIAKKIFNAGGTELSSTSWLVDTNNLTGYAQVFEERITTASPTPTTTVRFYTYGSDLISQAATTGGATTLRYFTYDGHGSTRELTDATGAVTDRYDYDAFGNLTHRSGTTANNFLYAGEQYDPDLGLYFLRARYFNPDSGRFWSQDDFEGINHDPFTLHKYVYGRGDPVRYSDPSGHLFTLRDAGLTTGVVGITGKIAIPTIVKATTFVVATAVALSIPSDTNIKRAQRKDINAMRLQLQQGLHTHFWSKAYAYAEPKWVTKADIYGGLGEMWTAVDMNTTQEPFPGSAMQELYRAIRMSAWVTKSGPLGGGIYTAHQEYAKSARIDLEQVSGLNFR